MTNEKNKEFFNSLRLNQTSRNKLFFQYCDFDFDCLKNINDNYELYAIETFIMKMSDIRISTFNTANSGKKWLPNQDDFFF